MASKGSRGVTCASPAAAADPCASSPCRNGGSCTNTQAPESHHCTCPVAFTGKDCSVGERGAGPRGRARSCPRGAGRPAWGRRRAGSWGLTARPPEKCFDETRREHMEEGDRWARVHRGRPQQCECAGGRVQCEDTRHTGAPRPGTGWGAASPEASCRVSPPLSCLRGRGSPRAGLMRLVPGGPRPSSAPPPSLPEQPVPERGHLPPDSGHRDHSMCLSPGPRRAALQHR